MWNPDWPSFAEAARPYAAPPRLFVAAIDFTPASAAAARRAAALAAATGAHLALFHALRGKPEGALQRLRLSAGRLGASFGLPIETHVGYGHAPAAIAAYAQGARAELIVVGNRQSSFLADLLGLHTAERLRRRTAIPVLAVSRAARRPYEQVLIATDLSPRTAQAWRVARRLFPAARLHLVHACEARYHGTLHFAGVSGDLEQAYRRQASVLAERRLAGLLSRELPGYEGGSTVRLGAPAEVIAGTASAIGADAVVLSPGKSWLARVVADSVTEQVLADPPCDVLLAA